MTTEKLKLAREALEYAANVLAPDHRRPVEKALAAIAAESAPAAASVGCQEFHELAMDYRAARFGAQTPYEALVTYVNAWGAQQREAGYEDGYVAACEEEDVEELRAQLAARPSVDLSKLQRYATITEMADHGKWLVAKLRADSGGAAVMLSDVEAMLSQDKPAALAQRAAGETAAKMPCGAAVTNVYEAYEAGTLAARAVGGVDEQVDCPVCDGHGAMHDADGEYISKCTSCHSTGIKPAAPVGDGDERETLAAINKALAYLVKPSCVDAAISTLRSLRAALTQQKG